jgi:uncharacterized protein (TIGR04255 family)
MARPRNLRNPPVVEALIDITTRFSVPADLARFAQLHADILADYPTQEIRNAFTVIITAPQGVVPAVAGSNAPIAYVFRAANNTRAVQSKSDGFSFSQLAPYQGWDAAIGEGIRVWELYRSRFRPERVLRLSVRFINRIKLPGPIMDFDDYIIAAPRVPAELPQGISEFSSSYVVPIAAKTIARMRMAFSAAEVTSTEIPLLLDIDILTECDIDPANVTEIMDSFAKLRVLKNHVFFGTLTEKAVELFE